MDEDDNYLKIAGLWAMILALASLITFIASGIMDKIFGL